MGDGAVGLQQAVHHSQPSTSHLEDWGSSSSPMCIPQPTPETAYSMEPRNSTGAAILTDKEQLFIKDLCVFLPAKNYLSSGH